MTSRAELMLCAASLLMCPPLAFGDKLQITSTPAGATVELDGARSAPRTFWRFYTGFIPT